MVDSTKDAGVIAVLLERLDKERLPRALALKEKVDRSEALSDYDVRFLDDFFRMLAKSNRLWIGILNTKIWQRVLFIFTMRSQRKHWKTRREHKCYGAEVSPAASHRDIFSLRWRHCV